MDDCEYRKIINSNTRKSQWKPVWRQVLVCSGTWISFFVYGLSLGAPTVFIPQIMKEANSTIVITEDMVSWLMSAFSWSTLPFVVIVNIATKMFGRKYTSLFSGAEALASFILLYFSTNITHIFISLIMQGFFGGSQLCLAGFILTEYTSPMNRALFLTINTATMYWGVWVSNAIGTFFHWKVIPFVGIGCAVYTFATVFTWPESPFWLATNGKFEKCVDAHRWLKGTSDESEKELEALINTQKKYIAGNSCKNVTIAYRIKDFFKTIKDEAFYKPLLLSLTCALLCILSGKIIFTVYILDIIKKITNSESTAYSGMLILDGVTVLSMYVGCALAKYFKQRPLLFITSSVPVGILFILSLYLYLINLDIIIENKYVTITLLTAFSVAVAGGPTIVCGSICAELIPVRSRNFALCLLAVISSLIMSSMLKLGPTLFKTFGMHGFFLSFGICSVITLAILFKYLPETKNKTLQEIMDSITGVKTTRHDRNAMLPITNSQSKSGELGSDETNPSTNSLA